MEGVGVCEPHLLGRVLAGAHGVWNTGQPPSPAAWEGPRGEGCPALLFGLVKMGEMWWNCWLGGDYWLKL